jgi:hypothetical protein
VTPQWEHNYIKDFSIHPCYLCYSLNTDGRRFEPGTYFSLGLVCKVILRTKVAPAPSHCVYEPARCISLFTNANACIRSFCCLFKWQFALAVYYKLTVYYTFIACLTCTFIHWGVATYCTVLTGGSEKSRWSRD